MGVPDNQIGVSFSMFCKLVSKTAGQSELRENEIWAQESTVQKSDLESDMLHKLDLDWPIRDFAAAKRCGKELQTLRRWIISGVQDDPLGGVYSLWCSKYVWEFVFHTKFELLGLFLYTELVTVLGSIMQVRLWFLALTQWFPTRKPCVESALTWQDGFNDLSAHKRQVFQLQSRVIQEPEKNVINSDWLKWF